MLNARRRCRRLATTALVVAALAPAPHAQEGRFGEEVSVVEVEVPVQVLRDGEPVRGLTREDFEILEGRKKREIVGFEVIDLSLTEGAPVAAAMLPVAARRHFLFLFDLSFSSPGSIVRARDAARELVRTGLHASDLAGVATVSSAEGVRMPLGFTSDRLQIDYAIATLGLPQLVESVRDPLGLTIADQEFFSQVASGPLGGGGGGRADVPDVRAEVEELLESMDTTVRVATDRNRILNLTGQLANLAAALRNLEGRKHVLYLSEGFDSSVIMGVGRGISEDEQAQIQGQAEASMRGEVWNVDSNLRFGETSSQNQLTGMLHEFVKSGCTIQAIDIAGLQGSDEVEREAYGEDGLFVMADETGGEFLRNFNDLPTAMGEVLERTSVTYLLTFSPGEVAADGNYHEIKVRLTGDDRGTRLVSRPGYYAPLPFAAQAPIERRASAAELVLGGEPGGDVAATLLTAAFPMATGASYVPALIEVGGESLLAGFEGERLPAEIYGYAIAADGRVADFFSQLLELDLGQHGAALRASGLKFWGHLELAPGSYSVRVLVRNSATGVQSLQVAGVEVPAAGVAQLLPPLVPEAQGKWLLARQQGAEVAQYPYPFLIDGEPLIPAARPVLGRNSQTRVALAGYNLGGETLAASAELRGLDGSPVEGVALALERRSAGEGPGFERLVASLTVGAVPAGQYDLVVSVRDEASGETRSSTLPVEIGS